MEQDSVLIHPSIHMMLRPKHRSPSIPIMGSSSDNSPAMLYEMDGVMAQVDHVVHHGVIPRNVIMLGASGADDWEVVRIHPNPIHMSHVGNDCTQSGRSGHKREQASTLASATPAF